VPDKLEECDDERDAETTDEDVEDTGDVAQSQRTRLRLQVIIITIISRPVD